jgi:hypothetical protein
MSCKHGGGMDKKLHAFYTLLDQSKIEGRNIYLVWNKSYEMCKVNWVEYQKKSMGKTTIIL